MADKTQSTFTDLHGNVTVIDKTDAKHPLLLDGDIWKGIHAGGHFELIAAQRGVILIIWGEQKDTFAIANCQGHNYFNNASEAMAYLVRVVMK